MINWQSILSSFDDKPTLLEWLKKVQKALNESSLTTVTVTQEKVGKVNNITLSFNFQDGTKIVAPAFTVQDGKDGKDGKDGLTPKIYKHLLRCSEQGNARQYNITVYSSKSDAITTDYVLANSTCLIGTISCVLNNNDGTVAFDRLISNVEQGPPGYFIISAGGATPSPVAIKIDSDSFEPL